METGKDFYRDFEEASGGPDDVVMERLSIYRDCIIVLKGKYDPCDVIDLGSGGREWVDLLGTMGVRVRGANQHEGMVGHYGERGSSAVLKDAVSFLRDCPDSSFAMVSGVHVAEHLDCVSFEGLFLQALRVLKPGGLLILDTANPDRLGSESSEFFADLTYVHQRLDRFLEFLAKYCGFPRIKVFWLEGTSCLQGTGRVTLADILGSGRFGCGLVAQKAGDSGFLKAFDEVFAKRKWLTTDDLSAQYDAYQDRRWLSVAENSRRMEAKANDLEIQVRMLKEDVRRLEAHLAGCIATTSPITGRQRLQQNLTRLSRLTPQRFYRGCMRRAMQVSAEIFGHFRQKAGLSSDNINLSDGDVSDIGGLSVLDAGAYYVAQRLLIVRGDLSSWTGYSHAIRAYVARLKDDYDRIIGVDIHIHPATKREAWPHPVVGDNQIATILTSHPWNATILTISTPDNFRRWFGATNIGLFFWETTRIGHPSWIARINTMDEIWAPSPFMESVLKEEGVIAPIRVVPCPLRIDTLRREPAPTSESRIFVQELRSSPGNATHQVTLSDLRDSARYLFLTTNSFIPRKGFAVLFQEWFSVARRYPESALLVKASSLNINETPADLKARLELLATDIARQHDLVSTKIYVYAGPLDPAGMAQMSQICDAAISLSFGEGLGLGLFENLLADKPIICPRHTAFSDYLPKEYPYFLETEIANIGLPDPAGVYPISARWGVPAEGALLKAVQRLFADLESGRLAELVDSAKKHFCDGCEEQWARSAP